MQYNDNREVNEVEHRKNGERNVIDSSKLLAYLGSDNYQNKAEEMLLDILNGIWPLDDAIEEVREHEV